MARTAIVDYGLCNLDSIRRTVEECGGDPVVTDRPADVAAAERMILPGVGAFPDAMRNLRAQGLDRAIRERVGAGIPLLGICLGMQLLASCGTEGEPTEGLGLLHANVKRLVPVDGERIPHIGWNEVVHERPSPLTDGIESGRDFYFVHSYHVDCAVGGSVVARTPYCGGFVSVVQSGRVFGTQFHPEKSQKSGLRLLRNFLAI
ncbi:MAG: imidazole glycerol phosphate synthase subunit HisH [Alphaproteobacteria bacterium]|nr:imidazole glycerol phosphate synthase subunit HisH [Alphaproteobacteria bacterium]